MPTNPGYEKILESQQKFFASGATRGREFRDRQLAALAEAVGNMEEEIFAALKEDLGKPAAEALSSEFAFVLEEIRFTRKHLKKWMQPKKLPTPPHLLPGKTFVHREPLGAALVIAPWNYPFQLALAPAVSALAAGNTVILKPSELAPATSALLKKLVESAFRPELFAVVEGGVPETTALLSLKFDHIFFTGSTKVGRIVYEAAAKNLTPVTLELGGKSPAIVAADADLALAARRIAWGRFANAGQTCVAPDYAYVHSSVAEEFLVKLEACVRDFYGDDPQKSHSYARIVNLQNLQRLDGLLSRERIRFGGVLSPRDKYLSPTVIYPATWQDPAMRDEIFGPILPVLPFEKVDDAFAEIRRHDKPLAAYVFTADKTLAKKFTETLSFGGGCVNDTVVHLSNPHAPFGGVGASGTGAYHGEKGFVTFSHEKTVLSRTRWLDLSVRYPPYTERKLSFMRKLLRAPSKK